MRIVGYLLILCRIVLLLKDANGSPLLLFANRRNMCLVDAGAGGDNSTVIVSGLEDAAALDFIYKDQTIYWTDITIMSIQSTSIDESQILITANQYKPSRQGKNVITSGLHSPDGIACDWLTRKLYWTDSANNHLEVSRLDGGGRRVLFWSDLDEPRAIALDPIRGYMYWTDWGEQPKIERAAMDGNPGSREVLVMKDRIFWPNGLTIDYEEERLYWMDAKLHYIHSIRLDGTDRKEVLSNASPYPYAITMFNENLYWTDWETRAIHTCNKHTGLQKRKVHTNIFSPMDIHVFHPDRQPTGVNPCGEDNGGCSDLCLMSPYSPYYTCACPTGFKLKPDNKTCADGPSEMLLLVRRPDIRRISLDTPDHTDVVLPLTNVRHAMTADYDPVERRFYWTDDEVVAISRARIDGTDQETLVTNDIQRPDGIAVDWIARNMYWIDAGTKRIEVARLNGTSRRVLITHGLSEPRALALHPMAGYMFWTDWGEKPAIERANLDGTHRVVLINTSLGWPNGIAIDYQLGNMYWGDAKLDRIEMSDMDGNNRKILASGDTLPHVFGISVLGDYVYWTDWQRRKVERIHKKTGLQREIIIEHLPDLMGIKALNVSAIIGTNGCWQNAAGCSHLCLAQPGGLDPVCGCPMGYELLPDLKTCFVPDAFLLFSRGQDIRRISLSSKASNNRPIPLTGIKEAIALDFDILDQRIYWTDTELKTISRAFLNGSALEHVIQFGLNYPEGMAVDWIAHNLYWADTGTNRIEMSRLDGSSRKVLVWDGLEYPRSIALDPANGYLYWTDWGSSPRLERSALDGSDRTTILKNTGRINGLTIDYTDGRIYMTDLDTNRIQSMDMYGNNRRTLVTESTPQQPYSLTQYDDFIYWAALKANTIERANKTTGENRSTIQTDMNPVMDLQVFHKSRQLGWNPCGDRNGGCSHLCVARHDVDGNSTSYCACPTHYTLQDKTTCKAPQDFLLYSMKSSVSRMILSHDDAPDIILPVKGLRNIKSLAYDPVGRYIYWVDSKTKSLKRVRDNGTDMSVVLDNKHKDKATNTPVDIAIDPYGRFLYWADDTANTINVTTLDGKAAVGSVISGKDQKPRKIALDPVAGQMFWINLVKPFPSITKARMDGTSVVSLLDSSLALPCALAVDPGTQTIYWADCILFKIESCNYDGSNRKVLQDHSLKAPIGLTVYGDHLYWIDKDQQTINRMDKLTGKNSITIQGRMTQLSDIDTVYMLTEAQLAAHPCFRNNGNCSHLCYAEKGNRKCSCPEGLILTPDEQTCSHNMHCPDDHFECVQTSQCISLKWKCDGDTDCDDESDELGCRDCTDNEFRCEDGMCIPASQRCDGTKNCPFGVDEDLCAPCDFGYWMCAEDRTCISTTQRCNNEVDCRAGEDEQNCHVYDPNSSESQEGGGGDRITTSISVLIGIAACFILLLVGCTVYCVRRRQKLYRRQLLRRTPDDTSETCEIIMANEPLKKSLGMDTGGGAMKGLSYPGGDHHPSNNTSPPHTLSHGGGGNKSGTTTCMTMSSNTSAGSPPYDRNHVTGASSSAASTVTTARYPHETLNPPPSPVTADDRSHAATGDLFSFTSQSPESTVRSAAGAYRYVPHSKPSRRHHYRHPHHHRHPVPAPPTTPCSTDVCDDSEPYMQASLRHYTNLPSQHAKYYPLSDSNSDDDFSGSSDVFYPGHHRHRRSSGNTPGRHRGHHYNPPPPPTTPTARSQCLSEVGGDYPPPPPSPSTERSFYQHNPYPPPPSPVANSDC